jgi:integrase
MALTDTAVRSAKPRQKPYKLSDSGGLFLLMQPSGGKLWRWKYRFQGKEKKLALGTYPATSLRDARERRDEARKLLEAGTDPADEKKRQQVAQAISAATTFGAVAQEFIEKMEKEGRADSTLVKARWFLELLNSSIGSRPIAEITPQELLAALQKVEKRGRLETAQRLRSFAGRVFRYAVATARASNNPAEPLAGALTTPKVTHHAAVLEPKKIGELLRAIDGYDGMPETRLALQLAPHVFLRPGELRQAKWQEVDLAQAVWTIPAERTKMRRPHLVPLSRQALAILHEAQLLTGRGQYVFPSTRTTTRPMSENTLTAALRRLGYLSGEMTAHGFRSIASTLLNESGRWGADAIERALAHKDTDAVRAAYHRGQHWQERVEMAQWWSDYLEQLKHGAKVTHLVARAGR